MIQAVRVFLSFLFPVTAPVVQMSPAIQFAGRAPDRQHWFRKKGVLWFNGSPGWPKLPLVQRLRASPFALNPVVSSQPEEEEEEELSDDPESLL